MTPLTLNAPARFGVAELHGFVPARHLRDDAARAMVREALARFGVMCLRLSEAIDGDTFRAVAEILGPIKDPVGRGRDGGTLRYDTDLQVIDAGFVLTDELRAQLGELTFGGLDDKRPGLFETWAGRSRSYA